MTTSISTNLRMDKVAARSEPSAPGAQTVVYFDGSCPLCSMEIGIYRRAADLTAGCSISFVDVSPISSSPAADLDRATAMSRFYLRAPDGTLQSGAPAFVALWRTLPGWRLLARLCDGRRRLRILNWIYDRFLLVRPHLSKFVSTVMQERHQAVDSDG
jgi:predicted DCC family thiol-disulfide oxidoreductase YuxK